MPPPVVLPAVVLLAVVLSAVALCAGAVLLTGGHRGAEPAVPEGRVTATPVDPPSDAGTDYRNPTVVCLRFAEALHRHDARTDTGPHDAYRRAAAYLTGELAAAVAAQPPGRDPTWLLWRAHQAVDDPSVTAVPADGDARPADGATQSYRAARVTSAPVGVDGWRGPVRQRLVECTLRRGTGGWRVAAYQISDPAGMP